jgi:hypothetical protein
MFFALELRVPATVAARSWLRKGRLWVDFLAWLRAAAVVRGREVETLLSQELDPVVVACLPLWASEGQPHRDSVAM